MPTVPDPPSRRRYLSALVGGTVLASAGATALAAVDLTTTSSTWGGTVRYRGLEIAGGPADEPLPQVPVRVDDEGYLHGRFPAASGDEIPTTELGGVRYSAEWFRYCDATEHPGLRGDADGDTYLRAAELPPPDLEGSPLPSYGWQREAVAPGDRLHVSHFDDYRSWTNGIGTAGIGKPAMATWRSQETDQPLHVQVLRSERVPGDVAGDDRWLAASTDAGFIAWSARCTNWCAVTAFKGYAASEKFAGADLAYCPRHQSTFDPFSVVASTQVTPRWEDGD